MILIQYQDHLDMGKILHRARVEAITHEDFESLKKIDTVRDLLDELLNEEFETETSNVYYGL